MNKIGLIIGFGSIGSQHHKAMIKSKLFKKIYILSKHYKKINHIRNLKEIKSINPDLVVICSETSAHFKQLKYIEKNLFDKIILVEKPLFSKTQKLTIKNNKVYVGYNLRYDPMLQYIKKFISKKKIITTSITCNSYLPGWRSRDSKKIYSSYKNMGGGVHLDLSHEIDYTNWIFEGFKKNTLTLKKISNLKIDSYDYLDLSGTSKFSKIINIKLNYFSIKNKRNIEIIIDNEVINVDLIKRTIEFSNLRRNIIKKFKKISSIERMVFQLKDIFNNKPYSACSYDDGLNVLKMLGV